MRTLNMNFEFIEP